jgi:hypothetical protein
VGADHPDLEGLEPGQIWQSQEDPETRVKILRVGMLHDLYPEEAEHPQRGETMNSPLVEWVRIDPHRPWSNNASIFKMSFKPEE